MADSIYRRISKPISKTGYRSSVTLGSYRHVNYGTEAPKITVEPVIPEPVVTPIMPVEDVKEEKDKKKFGYSIDVYENTSAAQAKNRLAAALQNDRANTRVIPTEIKVTTPNVTAPSDKAKDDGFDIE